MENLRTSGFLGLVILVRWALATMFLSWSTQTGCRIHRTYVSLIGSGEGRHTTHFLKCVLLLSTSQTDSKQSSDVLSDISFDILSDKSSDISSDKLTYLLTFFLTSFWHIFWHSFWKIFWHSFWPNKFQKVTSCETDWMRTWKHFKWTALMITTWTFMFSSRLTTKTTCTVEAVVAKEMFKHVYGSTRFVFKEKGLLRVFKKMRRLFQRMSTICGSMVRANNPVKIPWGTMWLASTTMWITNHLH